MTDETPEARLKRIEAEYLFPPMYRKSIREALPAMQLETPAMQNPQLRTLLATLEAQAHILTRDRLNLIAALRNIQAATTDPIIHEICERALIDQGEPK